MRARLLHCIIVSFLTGCGTLASGVPLAGQQVGPGPAGGIASVQFLPPPLPEGNPGTAPTAAGSGLPSFADQVLRQPGNPLAGGAEKPTLPLAPRPPQAREPRPSSLPVTALPPGGLGGMCYKPPGGVVLTSVEATPPPPASPAALAADKVPPIPSTPAALLHGQPAPAATPPTGAGPVSQLPPPQPPEAPAPRAVEADKAAPPQVGLPHATAGGLQHGPENLGSDLSSAAHPLTQEVTRVQPVVEVQQQILPPVGSEPVIPITIVVSNKGDLEVDNLTVTQALPPQHELVEATPLPERIRSTLHWSLGRLAPGQQSLVQIRLKGQPGASKIDLHNPVSVSFQTSARNTTAAEGPRPELKLTVKNPERATVGELVSFQLGITNQAARPSPALLVHTRLPASLSHPLGLNLENEVNPLAAGQTLTIPLQVTPTRPGLVRGKVRVEAQGVEAVEREFTMRVLEDRLGLTVSGPTLCAGGWPCPYGFTVSNDGNEAVRPARLVAHLPEGLGFVKASDNARYDADSHSVLWELGELAPGQKKTVLVDGVVRQAGTQECRVVLSAGQNRLKRVTWTTKVLATEARQGP